MNYQKCDHIKRSKPVFEVNEELSKELQAKAVILPLFEKGLFDHTFIKHYSLERNELLKCRWREYVEKIETRVFAPFQFPDIRDFHFYNQDVRMYRDGTTIHKNHRFHLKPGPGVDFLGQMPIPQDLFMKRGPTVKPVKRPAKSKLAGNKDGGMKIDKLKRGPM